ncbi:MAG TPA: signal recognition particle-docking protein FtsY [Anaerolineaceae bacterium]|nr:signal recognition particle-docking protein FtsY [Anaerolineaceae bacterium]
MPDLFSRWREGLSKTRKQTFDRLGALFSISEISAATWEALEAILVQADMGIETTESVVQNVKDQAGFDMITRNEQLINLLRAELIRRLDPPPEVNFDGIRPAIILLVGVNGSGKTTTAAKLGKQFAAQGKSVLLAAADTYRAAAVDQLQVWGDRLGLPVIAGQPNADPGAVAFDAVQAGLARKFDLVLVDTAGRLHTRFNLMEELKKVYRVVGKAMPGAPHATWLVLDATTGQNALLQARAFKEAVKVNGIILAKLDSSARGGMAFAIQRELGIPILYAGLGEKSDDLQRFSPEAFVDGLLSKK